ncbi:MAG: hypothetical protein R3A12_01980 [Ignavibacteria bacterium]
MRHKIFENPFRPQPILDAGKGNGMTVSQVIFVNAEYLTGNIQHSDTTL